MGKIIETYSHNTQYILARSKSFSKTVDKFQHRAVKKLKSNAISERLRRKNESSARIYKYFDHRRGIQYVNSNLNINTISWNFKARYGLIELNGNKFGDNNSHVNCKLCIALYVQH